MNTLFKKSLLLAAAFTLSMSMASAEETGRHFVVKEQRYECGNRETALGVLGNELIEKLAGISFGSPDALAILKQAAVGFFFVNFEDCLCKKEQAGHLDAKSLAACVVVSKQGALVYFDLNNAPTIIPDDVVSDALDSINTDALAAAFLP